MMVAPAELPLTLLGSLSNVLEYVYEPNICKPLLSRLLRLASRPLYEELPADSTIAMPSAGTPWTGTRRPTFETVFEMVPRIGLAGEAESAWFRERVLNRCVPSVPTYPTSSIQFLASAS